MSNTERQTVESIRAQYTERRVTKLDELKELHKKVRRPADVFAYIFGTLGSLVLGTGMCLAMPSVIEGYMIYGIIIGLVGIGMVSLNYFIWKAILKRRKNKFSREVFALSEQILGDNK